MASSKCCMPEPLQVRNLRPVAVRLEKRALLFDLGNQGVADHDLWHPLGEFEDIVPHPVRRLLIGGKCLVRAVKYADGDQHVRAAVKQIIAPEPLAFVASWARSPPAHVWQGAPLNRVSRCIF